MADQPNPPSDPEGVNPSGLGPGQPGPAPDNDRDQVPSDHDRERLDTPEQADMAETVEHERDA